MDDGVFGVGLAGDELVGVGRDAPSLFAGDSYTVLIDLGLVQSDRNVTDGKGVGDGGPRGQLSDGARDGHDHNQNQCNDHSQGFFHWVILLVKNKIRFI